MAKGILLEQWAGSMEFYRLSLSLNKKTSENKAKFLEATDILYIYDKHSNLPNQLTW